MKNRYIASLTAVTLLAGTSLALAQAGGNEAPASGAATAPSKSTHGATQPNSSDINRNQAPETKGAIPERKSTQTDEKMQRQNRNAQQTNPDKKDLQSTQDHSKDLKSKSSENNREQGRSGTKAESRSGQAEMDSKQSGNRSQTTGQAGAGAKLSTEQRTKITSVIREQKVQPETTINFNVAVGTRVPKTVHFHPLPAEIITVYPDWRGYEFFLVRDEIVVVNPRTLEIVAVLEV
ncbi:DUF1236 domain-containing protein [Nitrobacteraceae bacterium UC4446_H13]